MPLDDTILSQVDLARTLVEDTRLPERIRGWAPQLARAGLALAPSDFPAAKLAYVLAAIMDRESHGGDALTPEGPGGTGDFTARVGSYLTRNYVKRVQQVPDGWRVPKDRARRILPPPYAIPGDGLGWGRGLMQIDFGAHVAARTGAWADPTVNVLLGASVWRSAWDQLSTVDRFLPFVKGLRAPRMVDTQIDRALKRWREWKPLRHVVAAYNRGAPGVAWALARGEDPDDGTTDRYATAVCAAILEPPAGIV